MFRELPGEEFTFTERVGYIALIFPFFGFKSVGSISIKEPMRIQFGCSHTTEAESGTVHIVTRYHGIDRTEIEFARMFFGSGFHIIFYQCFCAEYDIFESGNLLQPVHEKIHATLGFC